MLEIERERERGGEREREGGGGREWGREGGREKNCLLGCMRFACADDAHFDCDFTLSHTHTHTLHFFSAPVEWGPSAPLCLSLT